MFASSKVNFHSQSEEPYCGQFLLEGGSTAWMCTTTENYIMTVLRASLRITVVGTAAPPTLSASATFSIIQSTQTSSVAAPFAPSLPAAPPSPASASIGPAVFGGLAIGSIATMAGVTVASILFIRHKRRTQYEWVSQTDPTPLGARTY